MMLWLIIRKELQIYFTSWLGWAIIGLTMLMAGVLFTALGLEQMFDGKGPSGGQTNQLTGMVAYNAFLYWTSGTFAVSTIFITMRLLADEQARGTDNLIYTSLVGDFTLVFGKYLAAVIFYTVMLLASLYIPLWIMSQASFEIGFLISGYLGLFLLGAACIAIGTFFSSITRMQIVAALATGATLLFLTIFGEAASSAPDPLDDIMLSLSIWHEHFTGFRMGKIKLIDLVYYLGIIVLFLTFTVKAVESRRWK